MADIVSVKTRVKIVGVAPMENYYIVDVDADIPGIIHREGVYRKGFVRRFVTTRDMSPQFHIGSTIDLVSTLHKAGEEYHGRILGNDIYVRDFDFVY